MAIASYFYSKSFDIEDFPPWPCPRCGRHSLAIRPDSLIMVETPDSLMDRRHQDWDLEWVTKRFACLLVCQTKRCGEVCSVGGEAGYRLNDTWPEDGDEPPTVVEPHFIEPAPAIFKIPTGCPRQARDELKSAFSLLWHDTSASLNRVRASLEALLDWKEVPRTVEGRKGALSLHDRIELFLPKDDPEQAKMLAVKYLGNVGSHGRGITRFQLIEALELVEHLLDIIVDNRPQRLDRMAREIVERKGRPPKPPF